MIVFAIDDEPLALEDLTDCIRAARPQAEVQAFQMAGDALEAVEERGVTPDVVFTDIQMPGMNGLEFAVRMKTAAPECRIVFVTAYSKYAVESYKVRAHGYLLKPVTEEQVREEFDSLPGLPEPQLKKLTVRCFGSFEVFFEGRALEFSRQKSKEVFAYLVKEQGAWVSTDELVSDLWEDTEDEQNEKSYLRVLTNDMLTTLRSVGMQDVLLKRRGRLAINAGMLDCDYYRMLEGDMQAVNAFRGAFMTQYGWAELLTGALYFRNLPLE